MITSKVYQDEPILRHAEHAADSMPRKYREMRRLAYSHHLYARPDAMIFYQQGKFMEDFEDEYDYRGVFSRYFPTYQSMNDQQLRGYFSWRTDIRRGILKKTSLSFVFVYVYELLNQIGVKSPEEGFRTLKNFWIAYWEIEPGINRYLKLWLRDYAVYHNLDRSLLGDVIDTEFDRAVLTLLDYGAHDAGEVFSALNALSSYDMTASRFYQQHPDDVKEVVCRVFTGLSDYYRKRYRNKERKRFFGEIYSSSYSMFRSAVFYEQGKHGDSVYELTDLCRFLCRDGKWFCERFFCCKDKLHQIGGLLKNIDFMMRRKYDFKSSLKAEAATKTALAVIDREIDRYLECGRKEAPTEIKIDVSKLQEIRSAALATQSKLIVEEAEEPAVPEMSAEPPEQENTAGLNDAEYRFMKCLLYGEPYEAFLKSEGLMLSVLVDSVNDHFFETFGDTVIGYDGETPEVLEDYADELKGIIGK